MMRSLLDQQCDAHVRELVLLGAQLDVTRGGKADPMWFYAARPGMREPIRAYLARIDRDAPGFDSAMVRAVMRLRYSGAP